MVHSDPEQRVHQVLNWISSAKGLSGIDGRPALRQQMDALRASPIGDEQRAKLLDLLYLHAERIALALQAQLANVQIPIPRPLKLATRETQAILEALAQDYLTTLSELYDPHRHAGSRLPVETMGRATQAIVWSMDIGYLAAAPENHGLWLQLHQIYANACRLDVAQTPAKTLSGDTLHQFYSRALLAAVAQPASFTAAELRLANAVIRQQTPPLEFADSAPSTATALFWIDPDIDFPAYALVRRNPAPDVRIRYFSGAPAAAHLQKLLDALAAGAPPATLQLPDEAATPAGRATLARLKKLWGQPAKRRFARRRQSYRATLCAGIDALRSVARTPHRASQSEWMVTNESPDGLAMMHVAGPAPNLRIGDIVAVKAIGEREEKQPHWLICLVRWAMSENPEHIEVGLELIAPHAIAGEIHTAGKAPAHIPVLVLPKAPPLRKRASLVAPTGTLRTSRQRLVLVMEKDNLEVREIHPTSIDEQTNSVDLFSFETDESD